MFADELSGETLLSTVIEGIDAAADDERITSIVLDLENLAGPSTSQAMEIIEALDRFSETGKPVIAIGDFFTQSQYLLASQADTIFKQYKITLVITIIQAHHLIFDQQS